MNKREIKGMAFGEELTNELWECPACMAWSNSIEWSITIEPPSLDDTKGIVKITCPRCLHTENNP